MTLCFISVRPVLRTVPGQEVTVVEGGEVRLQCELLAGQPPPRYGKYFIFIKKIFHILLEIFQDILEEGWRAAAHRGAGGGDRHHRAGEGQQAPGGDLPVCHQGWLRSAAGNQRRGGFCGV